MKAHVICCNDSVEHVVIGDESFANELMDQLKLASYNSDRYKYWHIHTVNLTVQSENLCQKST